MGNAARTFEELHIYQRARELTNRVYALTRDEAFARDRSLIDQLRRAAVSVVSNIAEGFERGTSVEFVQFLYIAKGSSGEVRAQLQIAADQQYIAEHQFASLAEFCRRLSGMISNFIDHLQSSNYAGDKVRRPQRRSFERAEKRREEVRASQLAGMRSATRQTPSEP